jgi:hypothetical protein
VSVTVNMHRELFVVDGQVVETLKVDTGLLTH